MILAPGGKLGPYEILSSLGAGGMGEVYKARDTRLERTVAIKVLPASLAHDPEFRARFDREAKSISALNHPHICTLYDVGEADGSSYLVMEHLEGETLADRLKKGPLPVADALAIASQIAEALDKAHRQGIVHRDLKPANVFLVRALGGSAHCKLLDFGLAKTGMAAASGSFETRLATSPPPAGTGTPLTAQGTILGTFQYMAPEQVEGQEADARADIWAFGCVLYEMLTGRRAFEGKSQASLIASILERQPTPITELQPLTPPALGRIVRTCLEKHADNRFHTAHDLWLQLQWIEEGGSAAGIPAPVLRERKRRSHLLIAGCVVTGAMLAGAAAWWLKPDYVPPQIVGRFNVPLPEGQGFTRLGRRVVAISPDGTSVAYIANRQIYLRKMEEFEARPIPGTEINPGDLTFSPDGQSLAFVSAPDDDLQNSGTIQRISIAGGTPLVLAAATSPLGLRWQRDRIIYSVGSAILSVPENGGAPQTLVDVGPDRRNRVTQPSLLPDGQSLLYSYRSRADQGPADSEIVVQPLDGGERRVLVSDAIVGRITSAGQLLWVRGNVLFAQPFDDASLQPTGAPVPVLEGLRVQPANGTAHYDISENGTLVYVTGEAEGTESELVWVDRTGRAEPLGVPPDNYRAPRISPDGTRVAFTVGQDDSHIAIWDIGRRTLSRLTTGPGNNRAPNWSPDGTSVYFLFNADIYRRSADGTGGRVRITNSESELIPLRPLPQPDRLLVRIAGANVLATLPTAGGQPERLLNADVPAQLNGHVSADGRWLAYQSREGGTRDEVHVRPFPDTDEGHWQISSGGGSQPVWSASGRELFYQIGLPARIVRVEVLPSSATGAFNYRTPSVLMDVSRYRTGAYFGYTWDVAPDGGRLLLVAPVGTQTEPQETAPAIRVVTNWLSEVSARVKRDTP